MVGRRVGVGGAATGKILLTSVEPWNKAPGGRLVITVIPESFPQQPLLVQRLRMQKRDQRRSSQGSRPTSPCQCPAEPCQDHCRVERVTDLPVDPVPDQFAIKGGLRKRRELSAMHARPEDGDGTSCTKQGKTAISPHLPHSPAKPQAQHQHAHEDQKLCGNPSPTSFKKSHGSFICLAAQLSASNPIPSSCHREHGTLNRWWRPLPVS